MIRLVYHWCRSEPLRTILSGAIAEGWRTSWWSQGEQSPHTVSLQDDPEFKAMMDEVKADLAAQLGRVWVMDSTWLVSTISIILGSPVPEG